MASIKFEEKVMPFEDYIKKVEAKVKNLGRIIKRFKIDDIQGYHLVRDTAPNKSMNEDVDKFEQMKLGIYENLESVLEQVDDQPDQL